VSLLRLVLAVGFFLFPRSFPDAQEAGSSPAGTAAPGALSEESPIFGGETPAVPAPQGEVSFLVVLRTVVVLLLAAAAIYALVYFLKRIARPRELRDPNLRVLATAHLGQNRFIHAVTLGTRVWLVGSGEGGVTHIADIEEQEAIDALLLEESGRNAVAGRFPDFRAMLGRLSPPKGPGLTGTSVADNIRKRQDRLKGL
jgi:flagellar protein FliO/FliZ